MISADFRWRWWNYYDKINKPIRFDGCETYSITFERLLFFSLSLSTFKPHFHSNDKNKQATKPIPFRHIENMITGNWYFSFISLTFSNRYIELTTEPQHSNTLSSWHRSFIEFIRRQTTRYHEIVYTQWNWWWSLCRYAFGSVLGIPFACK